MKIFFVILILSISSSFLSAEQGKMDAYSRHILNKIESEKQNPEKLSNNPKIPLVIENGEIYVDFLIKVQSSDVEQKIFELGGKVLVKAGEIWGVRIPINNTSKLIDEKSINSISTARPCKINNNNAVNNVNADKLHSGELGPQIKGNGVIVGVGDTGIDIEHPDFKGESGTRILYVWDMSNTTGINFPEGYDWGREFTKSNIDGGNCTQVDIDGHGTHVTGTAAGNGKGNSDYTGIAPEADIIFSKVSRMEDADRLTSDIEILAGVDYIFKKADELSKPCVVNLSLGTLIGPHDGSGLFSQGLSNLTGEGKIAVTSAGNDGNLPIHTSAEFEANEWFETLITPINICEIFEGFCPDIPNFFATAADFWYTGDAIDSVFVTAYSFNFGTGELMVQMTIGLAAGEAVESYKFENDLGLLGFIDADLRNTNLPENQSGNGFLQIHNGGNESCLIEEMVWSVAIKGKSTGKFDMWSALPGYAFIGVPGIYGEQLIGDNLMTIGHPADGKKVISVASYVTRNYWKFDNELEVESGSVIGEISAFSSVGPTRDGRVAPAIAAPGESLISALSKDANFDTIDGQYTPFQGTSMSSPVVTGIVALMLQVKPDLTYEEVLDILIKTGRSDEFTGDLPNVNFGYGKIDALACLRELIPLNVEEAKSIGFDVTINPNPSSQSISVSTIEVVGWKYIIFDANGRTYGEGTFDGNINISELQNGKYFLNLTKHLKSMALPFVVNR